MASVPTIRHDQITVQNVIYMTDPKAALLSACMQLTREIANQCPTAQRQCDRLMLWLRTMEEDAKIAVDSYDTGLDLSQCKTIYDAVVEFLRAHPDQEFTELQVLEAMVAGNVRGSKGLGFRGNFRRALSTQERSELEIKKSETGKREDDVIRLRPTAKIPPKRVR